MAITQRHVSRRWLLKAFPAALGTRPGWPQAESGSPAAFQVRPTRLFCREDGRLKRVLAADIKETAGRIEISAAGRTTRIDLSRARRSGPRVLLPVDAPDQETDFECIYRGDGKTLETRVRVAPERHWKLYLVHNCHHDIGYDDLPSKVRPEFLKELDDAVQYVNLTAGRPEEARFKWNVEISLVLEDYRRVRGEEAFSRLIGLLKTGSLELGALCNNIQTELLTVEPLHRSVHYATALRKEFGIPVQAAILDDVPGFTWALPDVFQSSGIRYFLFGGSPTRSNLFIGAMPILFYCQGPAGGKVLVFHSGKYSEGMIFTSRGGNKVDLSEPDLLAEALLDRYADGTYPYDAVLLQTANDFIRPYREISDHIEQWNRSWEFPRLRMATVSEFFRDVESRYGKQIPVLRGGCPDAWNDLRGSMAKETGLARRIENELPEAEKWATLAAIAGGADRSAALDRAYSDLLLFEEHTLGWHAGKADIYLDEAEGGGRRHHEEKIAPLHKAAETASGARTSSLAYLSAHIRRDTSPTLVVWNPLSWTRHGIVQAPAPEASSFALRDAASGENVPYQLIENRDHASQILFYAADVPATGYRTYTLDTGAPRAEPEEIQARDGALENRYYRLRMDPLSGCVAELIDKETGKDLVDAGAPHRLNQLIYVLSRELTHRRFEDFPEMRATRVRTAKPSAGPISAGIQSSGAIEYILTFDQEVVLYTGLKRVDFVTRLQKKPMYAKEGVYLAFPFSISGTQRFGRFNIPVRIDVPGGFLRPDADQLGGSSHDDYVSQHGVRLDDASKSLFWTSLDAPIVQFGGIQSNRWNTRLSEKNENMLAKPWLYSFVMNNHWYTNTPIAQGGEVTFRYSITSHGPQADLSADKRFGWELFSPMTAIWMDRGESGKWPESGSLAAVEPANVALAAVKRADDASGIILRVIETVGLASEASVRISIPGKKVAKAQVCGADESGGRDLPVSCGLVRLNVAPFEIATVRVLFEV